MHRGGLGKSHRRAQSQPEQTVRNRSRENHTGERALSQIRLQMLAAAGVGLRKLMGNQKMGGSSRSHKRAATGRAKSPRPEFERQLKWTNGGSGDLGHSLNWVRKEPRCLNWGVKGAS
ncbi:hypothetical protein Fot_43133 [Forsythia ovata]|uniref:Uncharacterized protein n=1 Tax=Forsythia ovata TaxID=205694 RepID=A0ABD1RNU4_9LAMI